MKSEVLECYKEYLRKLKAFYPKRNGSGKFLREEIKRVEKHVSKLESK